MYYRCFPFCVTALKSISLTSRSASYLCTDELHGFALRAFWVLGQALEQPHPHNVQYLPSSSGQKPSLRTMKL